MTDQDQGDHREITIETLVTPPLHIQPAPFVSRFVAAIVDSGLLWLVWEGLRYAFDQPLFAGFSQSAFITLFAFAFLYYFVMEWLFSGTVGKLAMKLRVVGSSGDPCTLHESALRNLLRIIDWLPIGYVLGIILMSISDKRQRAGDRIAHTVVTIAPKREATPPPAPFLFH